MNFTIERTHPTVITVRMEAGASGWEQSFLCRSDAHHDNLHCNQELERKHLEQAKERGAGIIDCGDLFCAMQGKWDKRADYSQLRPELRESHRPYLDALVAYNAEFYEPYAANWVMLSPGNHETSILQRHETNLTERLAERLKAAGSSLQVGSYQGWVRFMFTFRKDRHRSYRLRYTHGYGGGGQVTRDLIQANRQMVYIGNADILMSGHCFSEDTEILTPTGWRNHSSLAEGQLVATMNKETQKMEFNPINSVHRYDSYKELLHFQGLGRDIMVTPQHGMIYEAYRTGRLMECTAEQLDGKTDVKLFNGAPAVGDDLIDDRRLRFLAWVMADGNIDGNQVRFHLKKERKIGRLVSLLAELGYPYTTGQGDNGAVKINVTGCNWVSVELGSHKQYIPGQLYQLNARQAELFVLEYANTDGTFYQESADSGFQLFSSRKEILDLLQALCCRSGFRATYRHREDCSRLNVSRGGSTICSKITAEKVPYSGTVWCVNVNNGTLVVRRNGTTVITQNTHDAWNVPISREFLDANGKPVQQEVEVIKCGGYKDEYSPGNGWAVGKGHNPKPLGSYWLRFHYDGDTILFDVMRAK